MASAQLSISGKVTNQTGEVLPGATITIANPAQSSVANADGKYSFNNLNKGTYSLTVSYIGYLAVSKTITLNAASRVADFTLTSSSLTTETITITATRASKNSPTAFTNLSKKDLEKNNLGQDLPYLLNQTPSVVVSSDAGTGVGYTGIRIRGSDGSRINVTVNGIPYNDSESQGAFFVDVPDLASSVNNIQVQRGVGTSTNGAGAFGGSINIQTGTRRDTAYAELNNTIGSYSTVKNTVNVGTGLLGDHFTFDGRLSRVQSNGYIDRASSNLKSYFLSGAYYGKTATIRANVFTGYERTYQAWNGVPDYVIGDNSIQNNRRYNELGYISENNYYKDQVDDYTQHHYQLLYDQRITPELTFSGALHYTKGAGYYEEYCKDDDLQGTYGITPVIVGGDTIASTNLARRRWLDNDFYGVTYSLKYNPGKLNLIVGGAYNKYDGDHFGNVIYTEQSAGIGPNYEYYRNNAKKNDFNIFARAEYQWGKVLLYGDVQYRNVYYKIYGPENKQQFVNELAKFNFVNPKAGVTYQIDQHNNVYFSFAVGNREPNRNDYTDRLADQNKPKSENLKDFELGYRTTQSNFSAGINAYYMLYKNQLVITGQLNDVGSQIRKNVDDSYRAGIEVDGRVKITNQLSWAANATISTNKIKNLSQALSNTTEDYAPLPPVPQFFSKTNIAYSPSFIGGSEITFAPVKRGSIAFISKYVSKQYLDNTSNVNPDGITTSPDVANNSYAVNRFLKSYFVSDVRLNYNFSVSGVKNIGLTLLVNNVFSKKYEANGATYPGVTAGTLYNYNYFFPQATRNLLASVSLSF
ncbi:TonB-dependent receptor [Mucilaginibacter gynuensis]|uniref:TonB-dependent receptor n=1 Tax=Mucilaginibacter gynuensis TaxID=1302236 RepID=A0ABP8H9N8_9SPHI